MVKRTAVFTAIVFSLLAAGQPVCAQVPTLNALSALPGAVAPAEAVKVLFTILITGTAPSSGKINLEELDAAGSFIAERGVLVDDGKNGDLAAGDFIYSAQVELNKLLDGKRYFRARLSNGKKNFYSAMYTFYVTRFPVQPADTALKKKITDPVSGEKVIANILLVTFTPETDALAIAEIIAASGGKVIGTLLKLGIYQVELSGAPTMATINLAQQKLLKYKQVLSVEPDYVMSAPDSVF